MRRIAARVIGIVAALAIGAAVAGCQSPGASPSPTAPAAAPGEASPGSSPSTAPSHVGPSPVEPGFETPAPST